MVSRQPPTYSTGTSVSPLVMYGRRQRFHLWSCHPPLLVVADDHRSACCRSPTNFAAPISQRSCSTSTAHIDSNAAQAETWTQALREHGIACDITDIRPLVGMGGDKLLPRIAHLRRGLARGPVHRATKERRSSPSDCRTCRLRRAPAPCIAYLHQLQKELVVATSADDREMRGAAPASRRRRFDADADFERRRAESEAGP